MLLELHFPRAKYSQKIDGILCELSSKWNIELPVAHNSFKVEREKYECLEKHEKSSRRKCFSSVIINIMHSSFSKRIVSSRLPVLAHRDRIILSIELLPRFTGSFPFSVDAIPQVFRLLVHSFLSSISGS